MNAIRAEITGDTVYFFLHHKKIPFMSSVDCSYLNASDLPEALMHPIPEAPIAQMRETQLEP